MSISFAYLEGQEVEALDYFEKRLRIALDKGERDALSSIVEILRKKVMAKYGHLPKPEKPFLTLSCG